MFLCGLFAALIMAAPFTLHPARPYYTDIFERGFLGFPPTTRSAAMGTAGVMLTDGDGAPHNPALSALGDYEHFSGSFNPIRAEIYGLEDSKYRSESFSARLPLLGDSPFTIAINYSHEEFINGPYYINRDAWGNTISDPDKLYMTEDSRTAALSVAWTGRVQLAVGVGLKWIDVKLPEFNFKNWGRSLDVGFAARLPMRSVGTNLSNLSSLRFNADLLCGLSFQNYAPDFNITYDKYLPPKTIRYGFGLELAYGTGYYDWITVLPVFEKVTKFNNDPEPEYRMGVEVGLAEALYLRLGRFQSEEPDSFSEDGFSTFGASISTVGLRKLINSIKNSDHQSSESGRFSVNGLNLEFSFARVEKPFEWLEDTDYYSIRLTL